MGKKGKASANKGDLADALVERDAVARQAREAAELELERRARIKDRREAFERMARTVVMGRADEARRAVAALFRTAEQVQESGWKTDVRMPQSINYLQRYQALTRMQDRSRMLMRLEQTVQLAGRILGASERLDPDAACRQTAQGVREAMQRLGCVLVPPVTEPEPEPEAPVGAPGAKSVVRSMGKMLNEAFSESAPQFAEATLREASDEEFAALLDRVWSKMDEARLAFEKQEAERAVGDTLSPQDIPEYKGAVTFEMRYDVGELQELYGEVMRSLETFKRVVQDNGLFSAFLNESSYGQCRGYSFFWEGLYGEEMAAEYFGSDIGSRGGIPTAIEEDDNDGKGDSPARAVERMREFNAIPYYGMLDDSFTVHVEAFWYGFRKLMEFTNGLVEVDAHEFREYLNQARELLKNQAANLGARMDSQQLETWCDDVSELVAEYEKEHE